MEKEISFLHDELKNKNLLLETLIKYKNEKRMTWENHDVGNIQHEKNTQTTKSLETKEGDRILMKVIILITHHPIKLIMLTLEINHQREKTMQIIRHKRKVAPTAEKRHSLSVTRL